MGDQPIANPSSTQNSITPKYNHSHRSNQHTTKSFTTYLTKSSRMPLKCIISVHGPTIPGATRSLYRDNVGPSRGDVFGIRPKIKKCWGCNVHTHGRARGRAPGRLPATGLCCDAAQRATLHLECITDIITAYRLTAPADYPVRIIGRDRLTIGGL